MSAPSQRKELREFLESCEERPRDHVAWIGRIASSFARVMGAERGSVFGIGSRDDPRGFRVLHDAAAPDLADLLGRMPSDFPAFMRRGWQPGARVASWRRLTAFDPARASEMLSALVPGAHDLRGLFIELGPLAASVWVPLDEREAKRALPDRTLLRLHRRLSGALVREGGLATADLVVDEVGHVIHASLVGERGLLGRARDVAVAFARSAGPNIGMDDEAEALWDELWRGGWTVCESVDDGGRRVVLLRRSRADAPTPTARERAALRLAADGRALKRIAAELGTSEATASTHLQRGLRKLGLADRPALVRAFGGKQPSRR